MTRLSLLIGGIVICALTSCLRPPEYDPIPKIGFDSLTATYVKSGSDSITFFISFTDGDGDLGAASSDTKPNLFFKDSRTGFINSFQFPYVTPEGNVKDISGTIAYTFPSFSCVPGQSLDTLFYTIYISDRAGNLSNEVTTPNVVIDCQ